MMDSSLVVSQSTQSRDSLTGKIHNQTARVAIIGMGYVGLPLAVCVAKIGYRVDGIDLNIDRIHELNLGNSYIEDVQSDELSQLVEKGVITAYSDFSRLAYADVIVICVPTPLTRNNTPDISYIRSTGEQIAKHLRPGQFVTLESTTYPGTTMDVLLPLLESTGLQVGQDFFLAHSPERVDPGNARYTTHNTNKIVGGCTPACTDVAITFYQKSILNVISVSSPSCAEMVKVFENTFRSVNIAMVNELALLCDKMGLNIWEIVDAAATKPFGIMTFHPGPGVGGHCIPIDPFYLAWKAREYKFHTRFIELAGEINSGMPEFVREKVIRALGRQGKPLYGAKVLILGMAYKRDLNDWRHSPGVDLLHLMLKDEANVAYNDPHVPEIEDEFGVKHQSLPLTFDTLHKSDCVILITDHSSYNYDFIVEHSPLIVDTRNAFKAVENQREKIVLL